MKIISSELYVKDNKVYHEGNKPKPKDIGAAPETHTHNYASATTPGGSAEHAIKATEDSLGQRIDKYIKGLSVSGRTITYTRGDGTTGTITTQDNNTDTKVTNTLNTTAKAYITGTTDSATNTGTQVFDTNVYLDTTAGMLTATTFKGALQGNAATATSATSATSATKLATARTINGTSFDGTGNITTSNWGTARNIQIGNSSKSVNGSSNMTWTLAEIGAAPDGHTHNYAPKSHNHGLLHDNFGVTIENTTTDNGWSMINGSYNGFLLKSLRSSANAPAWLQGDYSAGIAFGGADTKGVMSVAYSRPSVRFAGGNGSKPVWHFTVNGSSGKTYNMDSLAANTANTLATPRTINGTNFNGSANITTANWGTARTLTIGNTGKSVNGSGNVSWSIGEIGAAPASHNHTSLTGITNLSFAAEGSDSASITTTVDGSSTYFDFNLSDDPSQNDMWRWRFRPSGANVFNAMTLDAISTTEAKLAVTGEVQATRLKGTLTGDVKGNVTGTVSGNAGSATKLATARTINGTNFDGSTNITTANWGATRNIYVADADGTNTGAAVSVNGSGNATLKLPSTIKASLSGNASTASTLATARTIGKASFNGSANITLAQIMGYATTESSGNGTYTNQWTKFATIDVSGGAWTECSGSFIFSSKEADAFSGTLQFYFRNGNTVESTSISLRWTELTNSSYANCVAAVKVSNGKYDLYFKPIVNYTIMSITALVEQVGRLTLHSYQSYSSSITAAATSSLSACANTANTLATARTINGTSFNGSANITTANWGTARNIQIGNAVKSVNGSANVSWSLSEIGAAPTSHGHSNMLTFKSNHTSDWTSSSAMSGKTYMGGWHGELTSGTTGYISLGAKGGNTLDLMIDGDIYVRENSKVYHAGNKPTASEIGAAASNHTHNYAGSSSAGGAANSANLLNIAGGRAASANSAVIVGPNTSMMLSTSSMTTGKPASDGYITEYRWDNNGGWSAQLFIPNNTTGVMQYRSMNAGTWGNWNTIYSTCNPQTTITGNAGTATKLQTARTINGTSFDGSANITTSLWGTSRNIYIADSDGTNTGSAVSVNGSANATLKLPATIKASLSGNASTATKLQTARTISLGGILSGSASFDGSGNVTINATANDITTITKSLKVTTSWADTGITGSNLGTGTYAVQMYVNDGTNTSQYQEYYSGMMSWFNGTTNSTDADEILLHKAGHASNGRHVYLRTIRTPNSGYLKLQISCTHAFSAASNITFKFKKLI